MRVIILLAALLTLSGCFMITAVEHSAYGGMNRNYSGGEVYSSDPSGHQVIRSKAVDGMLDQRSRLCGQDNESH